jgi:hypothetical protein
MHLGCTVWISLAVVALLAAGLGYTVDDTVRDTAEDSVRASFTANFSGASAFGPLLERQSAGLRLAADAVSSHGRIPDPAGFSRVRCGG